MYILNLTILRYYARCTRVIIFSVIRDYTMSMHFLFDPTPRFCNIDIHRYFYAVKTYMFRIKIILYIIVVFSFIKLKLLLRVYTLQVKNIFYFRVGNVANTGFCSNYKFHSRLNVRKLQNIRWY